MVLNSSILEDETWPQPSKPRGVKKLEQLSTAAALPLTKEPLSYQMGNWVRALLELCAGPVYIANSPYQAGLAYLLSEASTFPPSARHSLAGTVFGLFFSLTHSISPHLQLPYPLCV